MMRPHPLSAPDVMQPHKTTADARPGRFAPYRLIHKALRLMLQEGLTACGRLDARDARQRIALADDIEQRLCICELHITAQNRFFHGPLQARGARVVQGIQNDHWDQLACIDELRTCLHALRDTPQDPPAEAHDLYLQLSQFVADTLAHMAEEETFLTQALWSHFSDHEIMGFSRAADSAWPPEVQESLQRWLSRSLAAPELDSLQAG